MVGGGCRDCNAAGPHFDEESDRIVLRLSSYHNCPSLSSHVVTQIFVVVPAIQV
jgi:hypothetical protein